MAGLLSSSSSNKAEASIVEGRVGLLLLPSWVVIGILLVVPVLIMFVYSFLTQDFRGGVIWTFTLEAYDQFFLDRGLFGDEPPQIEWTYLLIFWRSFVQALFAMIFCAHFLACVNYFILEMNPDDSLADQANWMATMTRPSAWLIPL